MHAPDSRVLCGYGRGREGVQQARAELSVAIELYRNMEMTFWLERAEAVLTTI